MTTAKPGFNGLAQPTRWIILDDTDWRIAYEKDPAEQGEVWFAERVDGKYQGLEGAPYGGTLHGLKPHQHSSYLSVNVTGTGYTLFGVDNARNDTGTPDVTVDCFLDNRTTSPFPSRFPANPAPNWAFCGTTRTIPDNEHTVMVVPKTENKTFWFDRIQFVPSPDAQLWNETILVDNADPAFVFGAGWDGLEMDYSYARRKGSVLTFEFIGTSLSWYGATPAGFPDTLATSFTYTIDDLEPRTVQVPAMPSGMTRDARNSKLFDIPDLEMGEHRLKVVYNGDVQNVPLVLDYVIIRNGTNPDSSSSFSADASPLPDLITHSPRNSGPTRGGIIGGAVGAIFSLGILLAVGFLLLRRRRAGRIATRVDPFHAAPSPSHVFMRPTQNAKHLHSTPAFSSFIRHQDSGLRQGPALELPPEYSRR